MPKTVSLNIAQSIELAHTIMKSPSLLIAAATRDPPEGLALGAAAVWIGSGLGTSSSG